MLTADTIVPDPTNPQSFNRYSYVYNNPLRFNDPSGHEPVCHSTLGCSNIVTFDSTSIDAIWTDAEMEKVINGANAVAGALLSAAQDGQFADMAEAFLSVFGSAVKFLKTGTACSSGCWGETFFDRYTGEGDNRVYQGRHVIEVYTDANLTNRHADKWTVHELGHAFVNSGAGDRPISTLRIHQSFGFPDRPDPADENGYWGFAGPRRLNWEWQRSSRGTPSEEFADMFLGWTYGQWEPGRNGGWSNDGQMRASFMDVHMAEWIRDE